MKFLILLALVAVTLGTSTEKVKGRHSSVFNLPANAKVRAEDVEQFLRMQNDYDDADVEPVAGELRQAGATDAQIAAIPAEALKGDSSSGRLFLKKFLLFSNMFGSSNTQPIIPIIITGTGTTSSSGVTTTGTISGTGTITTSPQSRAGGIETDDYLIGEEDIIDEQPLNGKANNGNRQQNIIKLKQGKGSQQGLSFVVPPKYMRYFQNNPNAVVVNPNMYNNGAAGKMRKVRLNNNGNIKRKRSRSPVRRFVPVQ